MKDLEKKLAEAEVEIEELSVHVADMLGAALYFAGVKGKNIPKAAEVYLESIDKVYDDEDGEMGLEEIIKVIEYMQKHNKDLFE